MRGHVTRNVLAAVVGLGLVWASSSASPVGTPLAPAAGAAPGVQEQRSGSLVDARPAQRDMSAPTVATATPSVAAADSAATTADRTATATATMPRPRTAAAAPAAEPRTRFDLDGDGRDELVTAGFVTVAAGVSGYGVTVRYSRSGWHQYLLPPGQPRVNSRYGDALAAGDVDGDGYADLVVGDYVAGNSAGEVWVYPGGRDGIDPAAVQHLTQDTAGVPGVATAGAEFGRGVAAADLDGDGYADLAVGAPGEQVGGYPLAGTVTVLFGSADGLTTEGAQHVSQDSPGVPGQAAGQGMLGFAVAVGDVTGDGHPDVAAGAPGVDGAGAGSSVILLLGGPDGLRTDGATSVGGAEVGVGAFGETLRIADLDRDGYGDVLAGAPRSARGALVRLRGTAVGLTAAGAQLREPAEPYVAGDDGTGSFAGSLSTGDVTGDGYPDVLVGVPHERVGGSSSAGGVVLYPGSARGLGVAVPYRQGMTVPGYRGPVERPESGDWFGSAVAILDLDGTGPLEAVVGARYEDGSGLLTQLAAGRAPERSGPVLPGGTPTATSPWVLYPVEQWYWTDLSSPSGDRIPRITSAGRNLLG